MNHTTFHTRRRRADGATFTTNTRAARMCGPHHKAAAELYIERQNRLEFLIGPVGRRIADVDAVAAVQCAISSELAIQEHTGVDCPLTLDECISALIAARWARRFWAAYVAVEEAWQIYGVNLHGWSRQSRARRCYAPPLPYRLAA